MLNAEHNWGPTIATSLWCQLWVTSGSTGPAIDWRVARVNERLAFGCLRRAIDDLVAFWFQLVDGRVGVQSKASSAVMQADRCRCEMQNCEFQSKETNVASESRTYRAARVNVAVGLGFRLGPQKYDEFAASKIGQLAMCCDLCKACHTSL